MPHKEIRQNRNERFRGYMVYLIYKARPHRLELSQLQRLLDARNFPASRLRLAEELSFLCDAGLIAINHNDTQMGGVDWLERFADSDADQEIADALRAKLTTAGVNFQESTKPFEGIARVE
ncbi:MAG: hypothetical protein MSG64_07430 [Pyrinomonadaceae bacterium MAG19_C2-C3]|nr:hypothetical protein [Pyrinomonadaceae bacterium MAG19_C2-C3]